MWLHAGTDVVATDRIEWDDHAWQVDGDPERRPAPTRHGGRCCKRCERRS
ncbi:hypothetical protein [Actinomadura sp. NAK00032]|nr:hypothetical protein [Actinomadura sp. NAK00032]